jgi:dephospho-CoA kinase
MTSYKNFTISLNKKNQFVARKNNKIIAKEFSESELVKRIDAIIKNRSDLKMPSL